MSDYCVCPDCGCKHLVWEKSCPYCKRIEKLEAENKMLRKLAQAEAMAAVRTEHDLVHILISACKKTAIGREALMEWDVARTAKGE